MIVSLSGGLDSAVLLAKVMSNYDERGIAPVPVTFLYGSKHNDLEVAAAIRLAARYKLGLHHRVIDMRPAFAGVKSALTRQALLIPEGHYEADSMRATVVPGRNLIFASVLASIAESEKHAAIALGMHAGDAKIYPDCRPDFIRALGITILRSTEGKVGVETPLLHLEKPAIVGLGLQMSVPFHLTRTCYTSDPVACGRCGSCQERLLAFSKNGVEDPIEYASRDILPKE